MQMLYLVNAREMGTTFLYASRGRVHVQLCNYPNLQWSNADHRIPKTPKFSPTNALDDAPA